MQVDVGMAELVHALWAYGIETAYSCQGDPDGDSEDPAALAYVAFASPADTARFAARVARGRPGWLWVTEHEVAGGRDSVHLPPADLLWLCTQFT
ncbi:hypothetical protein FRAAL3156 [Frankia alni ACN14a]|uniref:Uncharacterized protein n=1 Tax=Frankia alni (strain DSM 45986 / CECT 9034 / ACN14a) TaxID=326424 RepID=Q0RL05_FRAAA|nr:hypothetical protein FRAAL3156 [Frankia alni ACN14a]